MATLELSLQMPEGGLFVDPGGQASCTLRVRNTGTVVMRVRFEVLGEAAAWTRVEPGEVGLFPGSDATVNVTFAPPRDATARPGPCPFAVKASLTGGPAESVVEEDTIEVGRFQAIGVAVRPRRARGVRRSRHRVVVTNTGNAPANVAIAADDHDERLRFRISPPALTVGAGDSGRVKLVAISDDSGAGEHPFTVNATTLGTNAPPVSTQGIMAQRRLLSTRVVALLALLAVVAVAVALFRPGGVLRPAQKIVSSATLSGAGTAGGSDTTQANGSGKAGSGGGGTATSSGQSTTIRLANTSPTKLTVARISGRTRPDATGLILKAPNVPAGSYAVWAKVTVYPKSNVGWEYVTCFVSHGNISQHDDTSFSAGTGAQLPSTSYITDTLSMEAGIKLTATTDVMLGCTTSQTVDFLVTDPVIMLLPVDQIS